MLQVAQRGPVADLPLERYTYVAGVQGQPAALVPVPRATCRVTYTPTLNLPRPDAIIQSADLLTRGTATLTGSEATLHQQLRLVPDDAKPATMVKLTPKLISTEFPDEDPQSMQKLVLPGKGIEKVDYLAVFSCYGPQANCKNAFIHLRRSFD